MRLKSADGSVSTVTESQVWRVRAKLEGYDRLVVTRSGDDIAEAIRVYLENYPHEKNIESIESIGYSVGGGYEGI